MVDYLDLLKSSQKYKERRDETTIITQDLKGMAMERLIGVWTATQSQRCAISMNVHTEENVSEDIGKINNVDITLTLNETPQEHKEGIMRLFFAKHRGGKKYDTITIHTDFEVTRFFDMFATETHQNIPEPKKLLEEESFCAPVPKEKLAKVKKPRKKNGVNHETN